MDKEFLVAAFDHKGNKVSEDFYSAKSRDEAVDKMNSASNQAKKLYNISFYIVQ